MGCSVRGCINNSARHPKGVKLFRVPGSLNDQSRRKDWLNALCIGQSFNAASGRVCELHFKATDWENVRQDGSRKLKLTAVPSINLPQKRIAFNDITHSSDNASVPSSLRSVRSNNEFDKSSDPVPCPSSPKQDVTIIRRNVAKDHTYASCLHPQISPHSGLLDPMISVIEDEKTVTPQIVHPTPLNISIHNTDFPLQEVPPITTVAVHSPNTLTLSDSSDASGEMISSSEELNEKFEDVVSRLQELEKENQILRQKAASYDKLTRETCFLRRTLVNERKAKNRLMNKPLTAQKNLSKILTEDQLKFLTRKSTRGMKWTPSSISEGLYFKNQCGTAAYADIASRFHLPAARTLQQWTESFKFRSGILYEVFQILKVIVENMSPRDRCCHICFDEMAIDPNDKLFDPSTKSPIGKCTLPGHTGTASKVLMIMVAGVNRRWKKVVAYYFSGNRDMKVDINFTAKEFAAILMNVVKETESIGLKVSSLSSDMGAENRALWRVLKIFAKRTGTVSNFISHPCTDLRRLYILPDIPHLFKNIVCMLQSNKIIVIPKGIAEKNGLPSNTVCIDHIKDLMEHEHQFELKIAFRLMQEAFTKKGHFEKMQVGRAMAIFNNRTVTGLRLLAEKKNKSEYKTTAWFVWLVVRWFNYVASRFPGVALSLRNKEAYTQALNHIQLTIEVFRTMVVGKKGDWKPSQEGIIIASTSILMLQEYYLNELDFKFLLTGRFNQDCLENRFSQIRRKQPTPNALQVKNLVKGIEISGRDCRPMRGHGYEYDEGEALLSMLFYCNNSASVLPKNETDPSLDSIHCPPITDTDVFEIIDDWELLPLYDMAGAALHAAIVTHNISPDCSCVLLLLWEGPGHHPFSEATTHNNYKEGALLEVNDQCFLAVVKTEINFRILRSSLTNIKGCNVIEEVMKRSKYVLEKFKSPNCAHTDLVHKLIKRYITIRWKQYGLKGRKDVAECAAVFSSKSHAMRQFVKNCGASN